MIPFKKCYCDKVNIISLGAGVQSSAMALMADRGELICSCGEKMKPQAAIFADTQDEPKNVMDWLDYLEPLLSFPVYRVTAGKLSDREREIHKSKKSGKHYRKSLVPAHCEGAGILTRKCTTNHKIIPLMRKQKELGNVGRGEREVKVASWIGISTDEIQRMKPSREPFAVCIYPLIEKGFSRQDCLKWMEKNGFPRPPRSACVFCPFHSNEEWHRLKTENPEDFEKAVVLEREMQLAWERDETSTSKPFLHPSHKLIDTIDFNDSSQMRLNLFNNECEGMCGV